MKRLLISLLLLGSGTSTLAQNALVVGYYPSWSKSSFPHTQIQYRSLTHIAHAFIFPAADGNLDLSGFSYYPELIQTAHMNSVGVVISVGGYDLARTPRFSQVVADSVLRKRFVNALVNFCVTNGYDGVDIDWEYPKSQDRVNGAKFFRELRAALSTANPSFFLSIAAPATDWGNGYDWTVMKDVLDWVGVMTYDFYGSWTPKAGPNSPLYGNFTQTDQGWIDNSMSFYKSKGLPLSKILIGTPFYGQQFNAAAMYGPSTGASQKTYSAIVPLLQQGWTRYWDATGHVPYLVNASQTIVTSYDDAVSIAEKMNYVKAQGLGGTIIWALGQDVVNSQQPLLNAVSGGLGLTSEVAATTTGSAPATFELLQNYPNPFNGETLIRYHIANPGLYALSVYDLLGREVERLIDREHLAGNYQVSCSSRTLPSGVYMYRLSGEGLTVVRTMIVLR